MLRCSRPSTTPPCASSSKPSEAETNNRSSSPLPPPRIDSEVLFSGVADSPDRIRAVVAYQQGSIRSQGDSYRTSPHVSIRQHKACQKIFIFAGRVSGLMQRHSNDLISGAHRLIPRPMLGGENVPFVL